MTAATPPSVLWTAVDAAAATGGRSRRHWQARRVTIDSRQVREGDLFVAIVGPSRDGHDFVRSALERGAVAAVVARTPEDVAEDAPLLHVQDTLAALEGLGRFARRRSAARIVGVTGSVGKTGSKEALLRICGRLGPTHASAASHNNQWGVPLSLANLPPEAHFGIFEMGMNHAGEISALTRQVRPHVALVTTIAAAHMAYFASIEAIADAKAEIFEGLEPGGVAVIQAEAPGVERLVAKAREAGARVVTFGERADAHVRLIASTLEADRSLVEVRLGEDEIELVVGIAGRHWVMNALGLIGVADALGLPMASVVEEIALLEAPAGRGARETVPLSDGQSCLLLDESYNANPRSVEAALAVLGRLPGRRVAILGDMLELGPEAASVHAALAAAVKDAGVELLLTCGPMMAHLSKAVGAGVETAHFARSEDLAERLGAHLRGGDAVLVKGSLGSRMKLVVKAMRDLAPKPQPQPARGG